MRKGVDCRGKEWEEKEISKFMKDISGKQFNKLTSLFPVKSDKKDGSYWLCLCECGNFLVVRASSLRSGHTTSCGCVQREIVSQKLAIDFSPGDQIGYWTIMHRADGYVGKGSYWHCKCKCGTEKDVKGGHLKDGSSLSCGCLQREIASYVKLVDLSGCRFGFLTVLGRSDKKIRGDVYWIVQCDCGIIKEVSGHNLRRGGVLSCGCITRSFGEIEIENLLNKHKVLFKPQYTFSDLVSDKNFPLRLDFGILDKDGKPVRLIEFDGQQHFEPVEYFGGEEGFKSIQKNDNLKNQYALSHNIPLVRIPYIKRNNITFEDLFGDQFLIKGE